MTVGQAGTVDWLGLERETGSILLTIVDDLGWANEADHLLALQAKLNTYLAFVESGEVFDRLLETVGRSVPRGTPITVSILAKYPPTPEAEEFLRHAKVVCQGIGVGLAHKVVVA